MFDQLDVVDSELFFQSSMSLLRTANNAEEESVDSMVVQDLVRELVKVSKDPLSKEARTVVRSYMSSEKPLYFIKNKLSAAQVGQIFTEITKETCPFRDVVPKVILVPMEAIFQNYSNGYLVGRFFDRMDLKRSFPYEARSTNEETHITISQAKDGCVGRLLSQ